MKRQEKLQEQLKDCQICIIPDPKIISVDMMQKVEFIENDFKERRKRKIISNLEAEEQIVRMNVTDFHTTLNTIQMKTLKQKYPTSKSLNHTQHTKSDQIKYFAHE